MKPARTNHVCTEEGLENYDEILQATDGIMVARGDLGMEIPSSKVFLAQKWMCRKANIAGKTVIVATQMLESMIGNPRPTRAECSDVANAVYDGADCVMLSGETANGPYFKEAVTIMAKTCVEAEGSRNYDHYYQSIRNSCVKGYGKLASGESLASSAVETAIDIDARLIVVLSETGTTARYVAKFRPAAHVVCLTPRATIARQAGGVLSGCKAFLVNSLEDDEALAKQVASQAIAAGLAKEGDMMVVVYGKSYGRGTNDHVKVESMEKGDTVMGDADALLGSLSAGF